MWVQLVANLATIAAVFFLWWQTNVSREVMEKQIDSIEENNTFNRSIQLAQLIEKTMTDATNKQIVFDNNAPYLDRLKALKKIIYVTSLLSINIKNNRIDNDILYPLVITHDLDIYMDKATTIVDKKAQFERDRNEDTVAYSIYKFILLNEKYTNILKTWLDEQRLKRIQED